MLTITIKSSRLQAEIARYKAEVLPVECLRTDYDYLSTTKRPKQGEIRLFIPWRRVEIQSAECNGCG